MSKFEFFMAFYGLLLGLAVAELLVGFGNLIRAARAPRWGLLTPLAGLLIFILLITSFADAWYNLKAVTIDLRGVTAPALIGVSFFMAAILVTPREAADWASLDDYYFARGRWAVAALMAVALLTIVLLELGLGHGPIMRIPFLDKVGYALSNAVILGALLTAVLSRRRAVVAAALVLVMAVIAALYATPYGTGDLLRLLLGR